MLHHQKKVSEEVRSLNRRTVIAVVSRTVSLLGIELDIGSVAVIGIIRIAEGTTVEPCIGTNQTWIVFLGKSGNVGPARTVGRALDFDHTGAQFIHGIHSSHREIHLELCTGRFGQIYTVASEIVTGPGGSIGRHGRKSHHHRKNKDQTYNLG